MRTLARLAARDHDTTSARAAARGCAGLALALALGAAGPTGFARAQSAVPCTAIENDAERLACYDRALRPLPAPAVRAQPAEPPAAAETERRRERNAREAAPPTPAAAPVARAPSPAPAPAPAAVGEEVVPIVIVAVRALPARPATFSARDGSTWVQTDSQRLNLPDTPFDAEIRRGAMGSSFLVPKDHRAIRVRRVADR